MRWLERVNIRTNVRTCVRTYVLTYIRTGQTLYPLHNFVVRGDKKGFSLITTLQPLWYDLELRMVPCYLERIAPVYPFYQFSMLTLLNISISVRLTSMKYGH